MQPVDHSRMYLIPRSILVRGSLLSKEGFGEHGKEGFGETAQLVPHK